MEVYIVPDWLTIIAGLVIYQRQPELQVLFGVRFDRKDVAGQWCLPAGLGAIRRDTSSALAAKAPESLKEPITVIQAMSERHQQAFLSPAGFALAEAKWCIQIPPEAGVEQLVPLKGISQLRSDGLLVKAYFGLDWKAEGPPKPAETPRPFQKIRFFTKAELKRVPVAFGCDKDLDEIFWPLMG